MKVLGLLVTLVLAMFFSGIATATPFLHDPQPIDNSIVGGGTRVFSINVTDDNLNSSSVTLHLISLNAYEQGENWDNHILSCTNSLTEWKCTKSISLGIAGSDTVELFYFTAKDMDGINGNNGTASASLKFTLDRNPPIFSFSHPTNGSYVRGNDTISIIVTDSTSNVNNNTVQYSTDNSIWMTLKNASLSLFESTWDTTGFSNNQTVTLYARATDNVGNNALTNINVTVDNETPRLVILSNLNGTLSGNVQLQVNVSDNYSGLNSGSAGYTVGSVSGTLGCTGGNYSAICSAVLDTVNLQDGNHTLNLTVNDKAGNSNMSSVKIKTSNTQPSIFIIDPANNAFVKETFLVRTNLANTEGIIKYVEVSMEQGGNVITKQNMTCSSSFANCNFSINSVPFTDGGYTVKTKVINTLNLDVSSSISVTVDNTKPSLTITQPTADVKGDFEIKSDVIDTNLNSNKITFNVSSFNGSLTCTPQTPSRFICSTTFNSRQLSDGKHTLNVSAQDKAGNLVVQSKEIMVTNQGVSSTTGGTSSGPSASSASTGETEKEIIEEKNKSKISSPLISISFKGEYLLFGIILIVVIVIVVILVIVVRHGLGKIIITD